MKKIIYILLIIFVVSYFSNNQDIIIPEESIRFRIIASSNNIEDQYQKNIIKKEIENNFLELVNNSHSIAETRKIIMDNKELLDNTLKKYNIDYKINYGLNYFPEKDYKGIKYDEGKYESLVIELGESKGDNWWCVMYPPLCLIDKEENTEKEYRFLVKDIINKLTSNS